MKRILINATHAEEVRVALCNGNHLYDFDLENRTREQKKANIYKAHVTRVEPSLEAVFVEYGSARQGFLPIREIANEYLAGDPRSNNIRQIIKEGDELIVQVEKEERGNKGAALSTYISLAGRYLVLMPNNPRGGGISRQISGKLRDEMKQAIASLSLPKGMSVILRTAGIGKSAEELQHDLDHLLSIWQNILYQNQNFPSPRLVHQEASVITRAVRDYLRDDISEIWVDNEYAYNEAASFIESMMPQQLGKLRKYLDYEPMFSRFGIERQIETAYQREVRLPSGGSIVIDQTEALVSIDINSAKSTKGSDVSETAFHTNLEAADEIARQLRLRDMGGLIVIDFIDMATEEHQKEVEQRIKEATKTDRARIQFAEISRFGLLEMSRQRLRPSLEEATGYLCPRCHGTGMIRDLRSLALSIMRQIEQKALQERQGEIQADVPTDIAAFLLNEKRDSLVYLEQESGTRITILPHAHLESPDFNIVYNAEGYAPPTYERISESQAQENHDRGYDIADWHTEEEVRNRTTDSNAWSNAPAPKPQSGQSTQNPAAKETANKPATQSLPTQPQTPAPSAVAWLSNLFAPTEQAQLASQISSHDAAAAIESIVNTGAKSLGVQGQIAYPTVQATQTANTAANVITTSEETPAQTTETTKRQSRKAKAKKGKRQDENTVEKSVEKEKSTQKTESLPKREPNSRRESRGEKRRQETLTLNDTQPVNDVSQQAVETIIQAQDNVADNNKEKAEQKPQPKEKSANEKSSKTKAATNADNVQVQVHKTAQPSVAEHSTHISLDNSKGEIIEPVVASAPIVSNEPPAETLITVDTNQDANATNTQADIKPVDNQNSDKPSISNEKPKVSTAVKAPKLALDVIPTNGRAKNDPREVYRAFNEKQNPVKAVKPTFAAITGTVGQFIQQYLPNADEQVANQGVLPSFIQALDAYHAQGQATEQTVTPDSLSSQQFDQFFCNYGYDDLSQDSLDSYHEMIAPTGTFYTVAGKTDAKPAPVTKRASNDPRGQIVNIETTNTKTVSQNDITVRVNDGVINSTSYAVGSAGAFIIDKLGEQGQQLIEKGQFVSAYLQALTTNKAVDTTKVAENVDINVNINDNANDTPATVSESPAVTDDGFAQGVEQSINDFIKDSDNAQSQLLQSVENLEQALTQALAETENQEEQNKGKTTPASYKNMIESVAEQMNLSKTGGVVLNLAQPKVTKPRTKKPKAEKAPAKPKTRTSKKAEGAVIVKKAKAQTTEPTDNPTPSGE